jgi:uncharacterized protein YktB (UPF0637 family)
MAGLGIGPDDFAIFRIADPDRRAAALESGLRPALAELADRLVAGLSRVSGEALLAYPGAIARRRGVAPEEAAVTFAASDKGYRGVPHLLLAVTRRELHARVAVRAAADRRGAMRLALAREASNLARRGKPFRRLRSYARWDHEELPEIAPTGSTAFWLEMAEALARGRNGAGGIDLGTAWSAEEARSLSIGDVLGAFRDLAPLYKLLASAR